MIGLAKINQSFGTGFVWFPVLVLVLELLEPISSFHDVGSPEKVHGINEPGKQVETSSSSNENHQASSQLLQLMGQILRESDDDTTLRQLCTLHRSVIAIEKALEDLINRKGGSRLSVCHENTIRDNNIRHKKLTKKLTRLLHYQGRR